ncbi:MAG: hypothetical protein WCG27_12700 [Pseudomonadota bacterium]
MKLLAIFFLLLLSFQTSAFDGQNMINLGMGNSLANLVFSKEKARTASQRDVKSEDIYLSLGLARALPMMEIIQFKVLASYAHYNTTNEKTYKTTSTRYRGGVGLVLNLYNSSNSMMGSIDDALFLCGIVGMEIEKYKTIDLDYADGYNWSDPPSKRTNKFVTLELGKRFSLSNLFGWEKISYAPEIFGEYSKNDKKSSYKSTITYGIYLINFNLRF